MQRLSVQTNYITHESLASYYVDTPDPNLRCSFIGQRMVISWFLSNNYLAYEDLRLRLKVRFRNRQEEEINIPIPHTAQGYYIYQLINERYSQVGGILTYKVEIVGNNCVLESWLHPLWVELIKFDIPK